MEGFCDEMMDLFDKESEALALEIAKLHEGADWTDPKAQVSLHFMQRHKETGNEQCTGHVQQHGDGWLGSYGTRSSVFKTMRAAVEYVEALARRLPERE